jgi:hypothetical protein
MLSRINKIVCLVFVMLSIFSCKNDQQKLLEKRKLLQQKSVSIIGHEEYTKIFNSAHDSIKSWTTNKLEAYLGKRLNIWEVDSLVCINNKGNKCVLAILIKSTFWKDAVQDNIDYFNGVKINDKWFFFKGPNLTLPREYYQKDIHTPLSFEKMKQLAMKNIFQGYLKKDNNGQLVVNEAFFGDLTSVAGCVNCTTQAQWGSAYLAVVRDNWKKRDNTDYDPNQ